MAIRIDWARPLSSHTRSASGHNDGRTGLVPGRCAFGSGHARGHAGRGSKMHFGRRVSEIFLFLTSRAWKQVALAGLLVLALVTFAGARSASAADSPTFDCTNGPGPNLTLKIFNNTMDYNIYPVVIAGGKDDQPTIATGASQWMQACFRVTFNNLKTQRYPRDGQYRFYVNCCGTDMNGMNENGIPPNGSVTIILPFYSPLVKDIDPNPDTRTSIPAQFINWWQGGGINMFQAPVKDGKPPQYLREFWAADQSNAVDPTDKNTTLGAKANPPTCGTGCALHFFRAPGAVDSWSPNQLIEYTMGAAGPNGNTGAAKPKQPFFVWDPTNLDYDVSNVNNTYMPAALEIDGNALVGTCCAIGWVGSTETLETFATNITNWSTSTLGKNWPAYIDQHHRAPDDKWPDDLHRHRHRRISRRSDEGTTNRRLEKSYFGAHRNLM